MQLTDLIASRIYTRPDEAPTLTAELQDICQVFLYTGRAPYILCKASENWSDSLADQRADFIPHGGTDLYRTISALLLLPQFRSSFPPVSIDSINASNATEAFDELGLAVPRHVIPLTINGSIDPDYVTKEHMRLFDRGDVRFCLTCIGVVYEELRRAGIPAMRIVHSRAVIRESLDKARLALDLSRAEAAQVAACVIYLQKTRLRRENRQSLQRALLLAARKCAHLLDGRIVRQAGHEVVVLATRGAAEHCIKSGLLPGEILPKHLSGIVAIGIGYGASASVAEEQGRKALDTAALCSRPLAVMKPGQLKRHRAENLQAVRRLKVSPTLARRLIDVFASLDPENFTANELARAFRLNPRSGRRLISLLRGQKLVRECGIEKLDGPGRPTRAYRIALSRLAEVLPVGSRKSRGR